MRFSNAIPLSLLLSTAAAAPFPQDEPTSTDTSTAIPTAASTDIPTALDQLAQLSNFAVNFTQDAVEDASSKSKRGNTCTLSNLSIRREWGAFSRQEKLNYIAAAKCLQTKQAKTPTSEIPGVRNRLDDFVGTHIQQTLNIHYTGTFLAWHRWFLYQHEQALRNECGYTGYQPYWDWSKSAASGMENSPVWDGSDTSMSGDGAHVANEGQVVLAGNGLPSVYLPHGNGGGCVTSGPFKNMSVNLGPVALTLANNGASTGANGDGLSYNPRCLKRDLTTAINARYANASSVVKLILQNNDIYSFEMIMQGVPGTGEIGVHGGGHYAMGGDPGRDVFTSPGDPAFFLHHGMIDRTWWIWQLLDAKNRAEGPNAISGTGTFLNSPPSANTTLDTLIDIGYASQVSKQQVAMKDLLSTVSGPFCYIYV